MNEMTHVANCYRHYHARYLAHDQDQRAAANQTMDIVRQRMRAFSQATDIFSGMDADFFKTANERLVVFRRFLKYSYILAYYLAENTNDNRIQNDLFQYHQGSLERFTEQLSRESGNAMSRLDRSQVINLLNIAEACLMNCLEFMHGTP
jgi:hypothetical protein